MWHPPAPKTRTWVVQSMSPAVALLQKLFELAAIRYPQPYRVANGDGQIRLHWEISRNKGKTKSTIFRLCVKFYSDFLVTFGGSGLMHVIPLLKDSFESWIWMRNYRWKTNGMEGKSDGFIQTTSMCAVLPRNHFNLKPQPTSAPRKSEGTIAPFNIKWLHLPSTMTA